MNTKCEAAKEDYLEQAEGTHSGIRLRLSLLSFERHHRKTDLFHFEKPLLVSDIDGLREPIIRDQTGILIQKNPKAIAKGIEQILEPQQLKTFQKNLNLKKKNYRWSSFAKKLLDFEREI